MIILGLTGSIGMGKSTVARQFAGQGAAICDSDRLVHQLLGKNGEAVAPVAGLFPETLEHDAINRTLLGKQVFGQPEKLKQLEAILHPLVRQRQQLFIKNALIKRKKLVIMDIPLLFETGSHTSWDYNVVVTAPYFLQRQRVLKREGMTEAKFHHILKRQMPDARKRKYADFIIPTGMGKYHSLKKVREIIRKIL